jgi:hypothetical protein
VHYNGAGVALAHLLAIRTQQTFELVACLYLPRLVKTVQMFAKEGFRAEEFSTYFVYLPYLKASSSPLVILPSRVTKINRTPLPKDKYSIAKKYDHRFPMRTIENSSRRHMIMLIYNFVFEFFEIKKPIILKDQKGVESMLLDYNADNFSIRQVPMANELKNILESDAIN